jgi:hypothetical protein
VSQAAERPAASEVIRSYALKAIDQEIAEMRPRFEQLCELSVKLHAQQPNGNGNGHLAGVGPTSNLPLSARSSGAKPVRKRRKMSAAARKRISDAQKARWARQKAADGKKGGRKH